MTTNPVSNRLQLSSYIIYSLHQPILCNPPSPPKKSTSNYRQIFATTKLKERSNINQDWVTHTSTGYGCAAARK